jgi:hypothetical protein
METFYSRNIFSQKFNETYGIQIWWVAVPLNDIFVFRKSILNIWARRRDTLKIYSSNWGEIIAAKKLVEPIGGQFGRELDKQCWYWSNVRY